jgi:hypothetical protein
MHRWDGRGGGNERVKFVSNMEKMTRARRVGERMDKRTSLVVVPELSHTKRIVVLRTTAVVFLLLTDRAAGAAYWFLCPFGTSTDAQHTPEPTESALFIFIIISTDSAACTSK